MDAFDIKQQCKKILFLHGFTSGGDCEISRTLMDALQGDVAATFKEDDTVET